VNESDQAVLAPRGKHLGNFAIRPAWSDAIAHDQKKALPAWVEQFTWTPHPTLRGFWASSNMQPNAASVRIGSASPELQVTEGPVPFKEPLQGDNGLPPDVH
jgi:hypothetical protein